ncbi:hypothetical protein OS493_019083 [Desmophyllum pertusum]|uniref:Uncharacterized protein n=1 Tax=Desmophyllum pertusum TaxID=174260 RepID=A0A9X0CK94_9CNID|nr:hypothetical protein OS493_019083 [Desmophyllum pertusum]
MMTFLWILLILGLVHGEENVEFDASESTIFSASIECPSGLKTTEKLQCKFHLKKQRPSGLFCAKMAYTA